LIAVPGLKGVNPKEEKNRLESKMPIFEFRCKKCCYKFEELVLKNSELNDIKCPKCESKEVEKLISVFGFRSTGSNGETISAGSSCTGCQRTTCAGCK